MVVIEMFVKHARDYFEVDLQISVYQDVAEPSHVAECRPEERRRVRDRA